MRDFRIRTENATELIQVLQEMGYGAQISKCRPKTTWGNGCSDPNCCAQHPEAIIENGIARMPDTWCAITTNAGSNLVHKILQEIYSEV